MRTASNHGLRWLWICRSPKKKKGSTMQVSLPIEPTTKINLKEGIDVCLEAQRICTQTIPHCLTKGGLHADVKHIRLLLECAEICALNANFMMRGSEHHYASSVLCAEICEACSMECSKFAEDIFMQRCADICKKCSSICRQLSEP